jgi:hypothetical protein
VEDVRMYDELREHLGWRRLYERVKEQREGFVNWIARRLMQGEPVDQREIDFHRGYFWGALDTLERPEKAEENLEKAARKAWTMAQLEVLNNEEDESPYV